MSREAISEQSSIREGAGYDEVFPSSHELEEGFSCRQRGKRQPNLLTRKWKVVKEKMR